jgi:hypothetical protein
MFVRRLYFLGDDGGFDLAVAAVGQIKEHLG